MLTHGSTMALLLRAVCLQVWTKAMVPIKVMGIVKKPFKDVPVSTRLSYEGQEFMADAVLKHQPVPKDITQVMKRLTMVSTCVSCPPETCH